MHWSDISSGEAKSLGAFKSGGGKSGRGEERENGSAVNPAIFRSSFLPPFRS